MVRCKSENDSQRIRKSKTVIAKSKREAERLLVDYVNECEQKYLLERSNITFEEFSRKWIEEYAKTNLSPVTNEGWRSSIEYTVVKYSVREW